MKALRPLKRFVASLGFLRSARNGGAALMVATLLALAWSNLSDSYSAIWACPVAGLRLDAWVNDGLMALFFLAVGLEIRWEWTQGALSSRRLAAAPALAALGGMAAPAAIFVMANRHDALSLHGWAVPVATDIAFALAAISVLGRRAPAGLKTFLTALAIIDDLLAIVVIALFYTREVSLAALAAEIGLCLALALMQRARVRCMSLYLLGGLAMWFAVRGAGVHPTLAGVLLAFLVPSGEGMRRLRHWLEGWVAWVVLPLFGLANGGLVLHGIAVPEPLVWGTALALILGKPLGVLGATGIASRLGLVHLPADVTRNHMLGGGLLCGIGFTMSLFINDLAFRGLPQEEAVRLGVFAGSVVAALAGMGVLARAPGR